MTGPNDKSKGPGRAVNAKHKSRKRTDKQALAADQFTARTIEHIPAVLKAVGTKWDDKEGVELSGENCFQLKCLIADLLHYFRLKGGDPCWLLILATETYSEDQFERGGYGVASGKTDKVNLKGPRGRRTK